MDGGAKLFGERRVAMRIEYYVVCSQHSQKAYSVEREPLEIGGLSSSGVKARPESSDCGDTSKGDASAHDQLGCWPAGN